MNKDESKKVIDEFIEWTADRGRPCKTTFDTFWQETHPEKHGGLTMKEWGQLVELKDVLVEVWEVVSEVELERCNRYLQEVHTLSNFMCTLGTSVTETDNNTSWTNARLLPDPEHFWRRCEEGQPVPDEVLVNRVSYYDDELHVNNEKLAMDIDWDFVICYQIVGVEE